MDIEKIEINISLNFGKIPIISALSAWVIPRKKIAEIISYTIQKDLDSWMLTRQIEQEKNAH